MNNAEKAKKPRHSEHEHGLFYFGRCAFPVKRRFMHLVRVHTFLATLVNVFFYISIYEMGGHGSLSPTRLLCVLNNGIVNAIAISRWRLHLSFNS